MSTLLLTKVADGGRGAIERLRGVWFPTLQTAIASGLAWYIANDVLGHRSRSLRRSPRRSACRSAMCYARSAPCK